MRTGSRQLREPLVERVLHRLGLGRKPSVDLEGLRAVYRAWCAHVPFDNVRKVVALRTGQNGRLPGGDAEDFLDHWLDHGTGGTCWPSSNALFALVDALGFEARRVAGSMADRGERNHGSVKVRQEGGDWLIDSSMLTRTPLPLGDRPYVHADPLVPVEIEPVAGGSEGTHVLWFDSPPLATWLPCRLLEDPVDHDYYLDRYERTRAQSPFNGMVTARLNREGVALMLRGPRITRRTPDGIVTHELAPEDLCRALITEVGISEEMVDTWRGCGGLEASFVSPPPAPPAPLRLPPSLRATEPGTGA